jgi:two-component system LytT family response regulator
MIEAVIIDDENNAIIALKNDLQTYCAEVHVAACFTGGGDALQYVRSSPPDMIFLDIDMPVMNGFDFIRLATDIRSHIIFVSAYSEFAIRAFKVNALDYLLKPIDPMELRAAVEKVSARRLVSADQGILLKNFINNYLSDNTKGKIALPTNDGYNLIDPAHIIYCKADSSYTEVVMDNDKNLLVSKTLGRLQELMPAEYFERTHQSYLINLNHVKKFRKGEQSVTVMSNNDVIKVSRLNKDRLAERLGIK